MEKTSEKEVREVTTPNQSKLISSNDNCSTEGRAETNYADKLDVGTREDGESSQKVEVGVLQPAKLMYMSVKVGKHNVLALLDTGASKTLVKAEYVNTNIEGSRTTISGIGGKMIEGIGHSNLELNICGVNFGWRCLVV